MNLKEFLDNLESAASNENARLEKLRISLGQIAAKVCELAPNANPCPPPTVTRPTA